MDHLQAVRTGPWSRKGDKVKGYNSVPASVISCLCVQQQCPITLAALSDDFIKPVNKTLLQSYQAAVRPSISSAP